MTAPDPTVTHGEWTVIGRADRQHKVRPITITTGVRQRVVYELTTGDYMDSCRRCDSGNEGTVEAYRHVSGGVCFQCGGDGLGDLLDGGLEQAIKWERANWLADQRAERKAEQRRAAAEAQGAAWRGEHAELADRLDTLMGDGEMWTPDCQQRMDPRLYELGMRVRGGQALTDKQTDFAARLVDEHDAEQARRARQRHAGHVDQKLTVAGVVAVAIPVESAYGSRMMIVIEGAGPDDGITAKTFSGAQAAWSVERGDEVTVTGTVKKHATYQDTPQTVLSRPAFTVTRRADP